MIIIKVITALISIKFTRQNAQHRDKQNYAKLNTTGFSLIVCFSSPISFVSETAVQDVMLQINIISLALSNVSLRTTCVCPCAFHVPSIILAYSHDNGYRIY